MAKKNSKQSKADLEEQSTIVVPKPDEFFQDISKKIEEAAVAGQTWSFAQDKWHRMRMCIKKTKTFPFTGCANLRLPTIETKLRKLKSNLVKIIFGQRPIVQAIPSPSGNLQTAQKIEKWVDHLINDIIGLKKNAIIAVDQSIEKGFYLMKPYWKTEITSRIEEYSIKDLDMNEAMKVYDPSTPPEVIKKALAQRLEVDMSDLVAEENDKELDRVIQEVLAGKPSIKCNLKDVLYNAPDVALANPEFVYVPSDSKYHPQSCRMITHEFYMPYDEVKRNVEFKNWSKSAVDAIEVFKNIPQDSMTEMTKDLREGVSRLGNPSALVRIWETYMYYDLDMDGYQEKCVFTFAPDFEQTLRKISIPNNNAKFPFVKLVNELTDDRWYSHRGMAEMIADLVREIDTQHNQKIDSQSLRNAPMISYRAGVVNPNLIKFQPAQAIPRHDPDDVLMINNTNLNTDFSYEKEQMILEGRIEELLGQPDFNLQSQINKRQPRTAFEVSQQQASSQQVFSLDADLYIESFSELFNFIWDLWCEKGDDNTEFAYFGENGWEKIRLNREEVQGKYKLVLRGNDQNFNPQVRQERASMIMQATLNPVALQTGVVSPMNVYNSYKKFYQTLDIPNWQEFITDPSQVKQRPQPAPVKINPENLTPSELAQVKASQGIQPDIQGMMLQHQEQNTKETAPVAMEEKQHQDKMIVELLKLRSQRAKDQNNERAETE